MSTPVMFNRRLGKSEIDIWLRLLEKETENGYIDRTIASQFLKHQDSISFVSSVEDEIIGGTIVHRDRIRLGMILASVSIKEEHRNHGAYNIIKSSLPFFRTVAIRDVEALIPKDKTNERIGFPGSLELDYWTKSILERIGFEDNSRLHYNRINVDEIQETSREVHFDNTTDIEKAKSLIWDFGKTAGLTNSHIWTSFNFAIGQKWLKSVTIKEKMKLVFGFYTIGKIGIVNFAMFEDEYFMNGLATKAIAEIAREARISQLILPLTGEGQQQFVQSIADELRGSLKSRSVTLMRKNL